MYVIFVILWFHKQFTLVRLTDAGIFYLQLGHANSFQVLKLTGYEHYGYLSSYYRLWGRDFVLKSIYLGINIAANTKFSPHVARGFLSQLFTHFHYPFCMNPFSIVKTKVFCFNSSVYCSDQMARSAAVPSQALYICHRA